MTKAELLKASRDELVAYLESWGFQCYASETTSQLREAAVENAQTEAREEKRREATCLSKSLKTIT